MEEFKKKFVLLVYIVFQNMPTIDMNLRMYEYTIKKQTDTKFLQ